MCCCLYFFTASDRMNLDWLMDNMQTRLLKRLKCKDFDNKCPFGTKLEFSRLLQPYSPKIDHRYCCRSCMRFILKNTFLLLLLTLVSCKVTKHLDTEKGERLLVRNSLQVKSEKGLSLGRKTSLSYELAPLYRQKPNSKSFIFFPHQTLALLQVQKQEIQIRQMDRLQTGRIACYLRLHTCVPHCQ